MESWSLLSRDKSWYTLQIEAWVFKESHTGKGHTHPSGGVGFQEKVFTMAFGVMLLKGCNLHGLKMKQTLSREELGSWLSG